MNEALEQIKDTLIDMAKEEALDLLRDKAEDVLDALTGEPWSDERMDEWQRLKLKEAWEER